jgi:twitching motility protein PilT
MSDSASRSKQNLLNVRQSQLDNKVDLNYLAKALVKYNASDLHLKVGRPPLFRVHGKLIPARMAPLDETSAEKILYSVMSPKQITELKEKRSIDFSFRASDLGRFRCNAYFQKGTLSAAIRMIPLVVPKVDSLGIPADVLMELCQKPRGLILITGATGDGKSTTLAALIQYLNETTSSHILTIEDPIEFVFRDGKALITQREVGSDTPSTKEGVLDGLRQDPDVIVVGEMRDYETIKATLTAAETGHLVISTLHTNDCRSTIDRILDTFSGDAQNQVRIQLASTLLGVVSQQLLTRADGNGRIVACEVMVKSPAIENFILKNELDRIFEAISNSNSYYKMQSMNQALEKLVHNNQITLEEALKSSPNPDDLKLRLAGVNRDEGYQVNPQS